MISEGKTNKKAIQLFFSENNPTQYAFHLIDDKLDDTKVLIRVTTSPNGTVRDAETDFKEVDQKQEYLDWLALFRLLERTGANIKGLMDVDLVKRAIQCHRTLTNSTTSYYAIPASAIS